MPPIPRRKKNALMLAEKGVKGFHSPAVVLTEPAQDLTEEDVNLALFMFQREEITKFPGKATYNGTSSRHERRKRKEQKAWIAASVGHPLMTSFFQPASSSVSTAPPLMIAPSSLHEPEPKPGLSLEEALEQLDEDCDVGKSMADNLRITAYEYTRLLFVRQYLTALSEGKGKMEASQTLSTSFKKGPYLATKIREWSEEYLANGFLESHRQGCHAKVASIVDEDVRSECLVWLRSQISESRGPVSLKKFLETKVMPKLTSSKVAKKTKISERTCSRYLHEWGFSFSAHTKNVYMDGHEREDVVEYRNVWVPRMLEFEKRMQLFEGEEMGQVQEPLLEPEERRMVQITHDECAFHAHDGKKSLWLQDEEQVLRKKGEGRALMVSGFVCPCHGLVDAEYLSVGKNHEGYWLSGNMVEHVMSYVLEVSEYETEKQFLSFSIGPEGHPHLREPAPRMRGPVLLRPEQQPRRDGSRRPDC